MTGSRRSGPKTPFATVTAPAASPAASGRGGRPALLVNAVELLRVPGSRKHISDLVVAADLEVEHAAIAGEIVVELDLESTIDDIGLAGTISVPRTGTCRRCLKPVAETITIDVDERYAEEPTPDDDAFPIVRGQLDLRAMTREEVLLAIEQAPLCRPDCPGLCPVCGQDVSVEPCDCDATLVDERWSVLDQLRDEV